MAVGRKSSSGARSRDRGSWSPSAESSTTSSWWLVAVVLWSEEEEVVSPSALASAFCWEWRARRAASWRRARDGGTLRGGGAGGGPVGGVGVSERVGWAGRNC